MTVGTTEAFPACAHIAAGHVSASAPIGTGVGLTFVVIHVTVCPTPPRVTVTFVPVEAVPASPMDAGVAAALVDLGQACGAMVALGAAAHEAIDFVQAAAILETRAAGTLIRVDFTVYALVARHADTLELPDLVQAGGIILTWV